ncbi:hypothetical protein K457DRAFT_735647 [Linnemannia elongata AG-77]|uniref:Uncharacterized protein n=1 Tax=Linnemannia elongata AG-77 TaxID=1314771 RepID=A0A197JLZ2_9FUNG|nr:hypothetical protein K457DRAFT_735647 [Linnemannia elongata AG-77]
MAVKRAACIVNASLLVPSFKETSKPSFLHQWPRQAHSSQQPLSPSFNETSKPSFLHQRPRQAHSSMIGRADIEGSKSNVAMNA